MFVSGRRFKSAEILLCALNAIDALGSAHALVHGPPVAARTAWRTQYLNADGLSDGYAYARADCCTSHGDGRAGDGYTSGPGTD